MNHDLVDKLAIEAGWVCIPGTDFGNSLQRLYNEKLVLLVVQECCKRIAPDWATVENTSPDDGIVVPKAIMAACREEMVAEIKNHFGIQP